MLNRKYFPFERNSYYSGKLLTAWDFEAEQRYFNDKRRFLSRLEGANGILAGLGVIKADDSSLIIQAGCALDASGREIVVPETKVVKLSTIEGYGELETDCAYLGLRYDEKPDDEAFSVMSGESGEKRHNKILEGFRLTLLDEAQVARVPGELDEYIRSTVLYASRDVEVTLRSPAYLPRVDSITLQLQITRLSAGSGEYAFTCFVEAPGFANGEGESGFEIALNNIKLSHGESSRLEVPLFPAAYLWGGGDCTISLANLVVRQGEESSTLNTTREAVIKPVDQSVTDFYLASAYSRAMDKTLNESYDEKLWIAKLLLIRANTSVIIGSIQPPPFGQYSYNSQQLMALHRLEEFYPRRSAGASVTVTAPADGARPAVQVEQGEQGRSTASGTFNLSLGLGNDQKGAIFSEEIMHGLGKGPVCVQLGVEYITSDEVSGDASEIILGNIGIFGERSGNDPNRTYKVETAVKILPERGTFIVGVRLGAPTELISLRIRWFAFRAGEVTRQIKSKQDGERMIMVNPDTIILPPKGTAHISPVFINMPSEACNYKLVDPEGGTIDQNGLYTAPARDGAYEIRVEAISDPSVYTHVFAIVSQKKK